jgi:glycosyltransferase involved in cell wall biosynthesis
MDNSSPHIVVAAYRYRQPTTGIGGAGGVLQTQEVVFGGEWRDLRFKYYLAPPQPPDISGVPAILAAAVQAARAAGLDTDLPSANSLADLPSSWVGINHYVTEAIAFGRELALQWPKSCFFVHEPATAVGLASVGARYSLVYHHQGSLATEQTQSFGRTLDPGDPPFWTLLERVAMRCAVQVHFPSAGAREAYLASAALQAHQAGAMGEPLFNTILPAAEQAGEADATVLRSIPSGPTLFVSIGLFSPAKGLDRVPAFLAHYRRLSGRPVCWLARGDGAYRDAVLEAIRRHGLQDSAIVVEHRIANTTLREILERADAYIMLHRRSIFDLATLEAMAAGCCTVLSRTGGNLDFNLDGTCLMVDEGAEAQAAARLASSDLRQLGRQARDTFQRHFSHDPYRARYEAAFARLLQDPVRHSQEPAPRSFSRFLHKLVRRYW